jgi:opacity protein-like surface antigen
MGGNFMKRILCLALLVVLALGAPAFAGSGSNKANKSGNGGEIGFGVGQTDVSSDTSGLGSAQVLGIRGGYHLNDQWQVEGQFSSSSDSGTISGTDVDTTTRLLMVNGVMNFHPKKKEFVPYVMAGIGRADVSVDATGTSVSDNSVAYQIGGGTRIFFGKTKVMAFRADLSLLRDTAFSDSSTLTTLTAGITWKLGGR